MVIPSPQFPHTLPPSQVKGPSVSLPVASVASRNYAFFFCLLTQLQPQVAKMTGIFVIDKIATHTYKKNNNSGIYLVCTWQNEFFKAYRLPLLPRAVY